MIESGLIETLLNILWGFYRILVRVDRSNLQKSVYAQSVDWSIIPRLPLNFCKGFPHWDLFAFSGKHNSEAISAQLTNQLFIFLYTFTVSGFQCISWGVIRFISSFIFSNYTVLKIVFLPKKVSAIRIVEYSIISILDDFKDTLANLGLPEAWVE